ncbi:flavin monoamine oxidase family protein [Phytohabitans kaempferiae]|uniref:Flavin monoamine oxidase family protein n=1 Tax=Phytohabitans kaempferiae TaxID=1620943 RepID=A0ABV6MHX2_9ACTN
MATPEVDVVVIGGGLAGLMAARALSASGRSVRVLEARDRVGGRTWTRTAASGVPIDFGGQWIGPSQERVTALAAELGIETFPTYAAGSTQYSILETSQVERADARAAMDELDRMAAQVPVEAPWEADEASAWDGQTLQSWLLGRSLDDVSRELLRVLMTGLFTMEPEELSLLHVITYIRSAGSLHQLIKVAQENRLTGGAQTLSLRMADELGPDVVRLASPATAIAQDDSCVRVTTDSEVITARRAIVAVPIVLTDRISFEPPLPAARVQLIQRFATGAAVKVHCVYPDAFWRDNGWNGRSLTGSGYVSVTFDNSPPDGSKGVLVGFIEADKARQFIGLSDTDRRDAVVARFVELFGERAADPDEYLEFEWSEEEWTRGCYSANLAPGGWTRYGPALRRSTGRVHWAGSETSTVWMGYMEGALRSGERAAEEVGLALDGASGRE